MKIKGWERRVKIFIVLNGRIHHVFFYCKTETVFLITKRFVNGRVLGLITAELLTELTAILPAEQIVEEFNQNHPLGNSGQIIVYPQTEEEISGVMKYANDNGRKVVVEAGGTKRGFGGQESTADILLSLIRYKGVTEHTVGDMTLTVKSGTTFQEIQDYLAKYHQKVSLDPAWPENATIGGIIASNESGPKRLGYGSARDVVIGLRLIYPDGKVIRTGGKVVKNVAGYDMNKLFIGSMGTLGIVSEITVKLRPLPKYEGLVILRFAHENLESIRSFAAQLLDSAMEPISLELLNPSLSKKLLGFDAYTLAISFEDVENSVRYQLDFIQGMQPSNTDLIIFQQKDAQGFWNEFYKTAPNGAEVSPEYQTEAALKIGVVNLNVLEAVKEAHRLQDSHNLLIEAHGGLGHGLCQINLRGANEDVANAIEHLRNAVTKLGGYVIVKHLPYHLRQKISVWGEKPTYFFLLEGIKSKIDPNKVLNPSRFVGGI